MHQEQERGITITSGPDDTLTTQCRTLSRRELDDELLHKLKAMNGDYDGNVGWPSNAKPVGVSKSPKVKGKRKAQRKARRANRK